MMDDMLVKHSGFLYRCCIGMPGCSMICQDMATTLRNGCRPSERSMQVDASCIMKEQALTICAMAEVGVRGMII